MASPTTNLVIVHDVLGTLFGLSRPIEALRSHFDDQLGGASTPDVVKQRHADLIIMDWYHCGMRDFTNLSINGAYKPIGECFKAALHRVLLMAGLVPPKGLDGRGRPQAGPASEEELAQIKKAAATGGPTFEAEARDIFGTLSTLEPRPGMVEAFTKLYRDPSKLPSSVENVALWGATNGSLALAGKLFEGALSSSGLSTQSHQKPEAGSRSLGTNLGLWSCDEIRVAKPDPRVYQELLKKVREGLDESNDKKTSLWFVASHTWDTDAAKRAG